MLITVKTFNGHNINDGSNYRAVLQNPYGMPDATPVFIEQTNADAVDAGRYAVGVQNRVLNIKILNYANRYALISQLKTWFKRGTEGLLVVTFADEGVDYQMKCRSVNLVQEPEYPERFTAILQTGISAWRAVTETTQATWTATGATETQAISVGGKDETFLSADITVVSGPASGYLYQNLYRLPNTPNLIHGLIPWCITVNTAALVTAGKMQADCDDLRIVDLNTGQELKRWIANPNNSATKVWVNLNMSGQGSFLLLDAVASSGAIEYLQFQNTLDAQVYINALPPSGVVYHGTEWFAYNSTDPVNCRLYIAQRGAFGTTLQAHAANDVFYFLQYPLLMKYGNASAAAPSAADATYDDTKPLFNLASSSNTSWVWTASDKFYDPQHPNRTGGWTFTKQTLGTESDAFFVKQNAASGDAALGFKIASFQSGSLWKDENVVFKGVVYRATGFTSVSMTGDKYRSNDNWIGNSLFAFSYFGGLLTKQYLVLLWAEATPASEDTWTAWTHNSVSVTPFIQQALQFWFWGGYPGAENAYAASEMLTCTVVFDSTYIPTGTFLGEVASYPLEVTLENETTGDAITLNYIMLIGSTFSVDGENQIVQYNGVNAFGAVTMDDEGRAAYLRLQGGATNTIRISGDDLGELSIVLSWYRRRL